jgi:hypothetical protein
MKYGKAIVSILVAIAFVSIAKALWCHRRNSKVTGAMSEQLPPCIFCNNESGSEEHFWPAWVHRFIKENGIDLGGLRVQLGNQPETITDDLEKTINTVCNTCNNTWMSEVEDKNRRRFQYMLKNDPLTIDPGGMKIITEWAVLRAIMLDSEKPSIGQENFYTPDERIPMRERLEIPKRTRVWFGALDGFHLGGHGTDFTIEAVTPEGNRVRIGTGCYNTIYMGYLVTQVVTEHLYPQYEGLGIAEVQPPPSICDERLVQIHPRPRQLKKFDWPTTPFTNGDPDGIGYLMYRWKKDAKQVSTVTKNGVVE